MHSIRPNDSCPGMKGQDFKKLETKGFTPSIGIQIYADIELSSFSSPAFSTYRIHWRDQQVREKFRRPSSKHIRCRDLKHDLVPGIAAAFRYPLQPQGATLHPYHRVPGVSQVISTKLITTLTTTLTNPPQSPPALLELQESSAFSTWQRSSARGLSVPSTNSLRVTCTGWCLLA